MKKQLIILGIVIVLSPVAICQDIPVYMDNKIVGYLYEEVVPNVNNVDDCYLLDTLTIFENKIIIQTKVDYFTTDGGIDLFSIYTLIEVEESSNDTVIIRFSEDSDKIFGISIKKYETGEVRIYNLFSFFRNEPDNIYTTKVDILLDDKIIVTHSENDTFKFPSCNKRQDEDKH